MLTSSMESVLAKWRAERQEDDVDDDNDNCDVVGDNESPRKLVVLPLRAGRRDNIDIGFGCDVKIERRKH